MLITDYSIVRIFNFIKTDRSSEYPNVPITPSHTLIILNAMVNKLKNIFQLPIVIDKRNMLWVVISVFIINKPELSQRV